MLANNSCERQRGDSRLRVSYLHFPSRSCDLTAAVSESNSVLIAIGGQRCDAGNFAEIFAVHLDLCPGSRQRAFDFKPHERAMYGSARANALDDLLTDVAAFGEIESARLLGFLRQIALANVLSVARNSSRNAEQLDGCFANRCGSGIGQRFPQSFCLTGRTPQFVRFD